MRGIIGPQTNEASNILSFRKQCAVLLLAGAVLTCAAAIRSFEYDEAYSVFVTSPTPRPAWPATMFRAGEVRAAFTTHAGPAAIARALRETDVHPPLYFWALACWRQIAGDGLLAMRLLSVLCALAALVAVGAIAREAAISASLSTLFTAGCYGFAYTGVVTRGFALAQALSLCGVLLVLRAARQERWREALAGGVLLGAATLANYLSAFVGVAALLWLLAAGGRRVSLWISAGLGFAAFLPADLWFFLAQRGSRVGQFPPFRLGPSLVRLAEYAVANLFGGLPLYADGAARMFVGAALGAAMLVLILVVACRWRFLPGDARWLLLGGTLAPPLGLLALGAMFDNTPIELRYLCFATPFAGLLLAGALEDQQLSLSRLRERVGVRVPPAPFTPTLSPRKGGWRGRCAAGVLSLQALAILGLILRPETMQPARSLAHQAAALAGPGGVIVLPRGNDGVGVVGPFLAELPDAARVLLVSATDDPLTLRARLPPEPVVLVLLGEDTASRAALEVMRAAFPCQSSPVLRNGLCSAKAAISARIEGVSCLSESATARRSPGWAIQCAE